MGRIISYIGEEKVNRNGKKYRSVKVTGDETWYAAYAKALSALANFKVGDEVDFDISDKGPFINNIQLTQSGSGSVRAVQPAPSGGHPATNPNSEKDMAVYTRYALDAVLGGKSEEEALRLVFSLRERVRAILASPKGTVEGVNEAMELKERAIEELAKQAKVDTSTDSWVQFRKRFKKQDVLMVELDQVIKGNKVFQFDPDGNLALVEA